MLRTNIPNGRRSRLMAGGYTLVELSISTGIIALLAVGGLAAIQKKAEADHLRETKYKIRAIRAALDKYIRINGYVPCPASPSLAQDSRYFGRDKRGDGMNEVSLYDPATGECTGDDVDHDAGMVPVRTLNLADDFAYDGWDRQFAYRIAGKAADSEEMQNLTYRGNLRVVDLQGNNITDIDNPPPNNHGALYVVISFGPDGKGAAWPKRVSSAAGALRKEDKPSEDAVSGVQKQNLRHERGIYLQDGPAEGFDDLVIFGSKHSVTPPKEVYLPTPLHEDSCGNADLLLGTPELVGDLPGNKPFKEKVFKIIKELKALCAYQPKSSALGQSAAQAEGVSFWFDAEKPLSEGARPTDATIDWQGRNGLIAKRSGGVLYDGSINNRPAFDMHLGSGGFTLDSLLPGMDSVDPNYYFGGTVTEVNPNRLNLASAPNLAEEKQQFTLFTAIRTAGNINLPQTLYASSDNNNKNFRLRLSGGAVYGYMAGVMTYGRAVLPNHTYIIGFSRGPSGVMFVSDSERAFTADTMPKAEIGDKQYLLNSADGGEGFQGQVGEVLLFNSQLSEKSFYQNIAALDAKWGGSFNYDKFAPVECPFKGQKYISTSADPDRKCQCPEGTALNTEIPSRNPCLAQSKNIGECVPLSRYSTEAIEQRATPGKPVFTPQQVSGTILWLDGADCSTITLDDKRRVTTWRDKSAAGNDFVQSDPQKRPGYELRLKADSQALSDWNMLRFSGASHPEYLENKGCPPGGGGCRSLSLGSLPKEKIGGQDYVGYSIFVAAQVPSTNVDKHTTLFNSGRHDWGFKFLNSGVPYGYVRHASQTNLDGFYEAQMTEGINISLLDYASYGARTQVFSAYMSMPVGSQDWQTHRTNQRVRMVPTGLITVSLGLGTPHNKMRIKDSEVLGALAANSGAYQSEKLFPLSVPVTVSDEIHTIGATSFPGFSGDKLHAFDGRIGEVVVIGHSLLNSGVNANNANLVRYLSCKWQNQCNYTPP